MLQRGHRSAAVRGAAGLAGIIFLLAGCADTPDRYNPIEWGKSAAREVGNLFGGPDVPPSAEPPAPEGRPYPNLATVPKPVRETPAQKAQRAADLERLTQERDRALADDQALRDTGVMPPPPPDLPPPEVAAAAPPPARPAGVANPVPAPMTPVERPAPAAPAAVPTTPVSPAPAAAAVAPAVSAAVTAPVSAQRLGGVSFPRNANTLPATGQRVLTEAAALARTGDGRVHLVAAQTAREGMTLEVARARQAAILQALTSGGLPASRVIIDDALGRRVDLYDVYVER